MAHVMNLVEYLGDEEPIQLKQMASRAVAEGSGCSRPNHPDRN